MLKLNSGIERFVISIIAILVFCHIVACLYHLLGSFESAYHNTWVFRFNFVDSSIYEVIY